MKSFKNLTFAVFLVAALCLFFSCSDSSDSSNSDGTVVIGNTQNEWTTKINNGMTNLGSEVINNDVEINRSLTLKGGNFSGHTIYVRKSGVTIDGVTNANVVIADEKSEGSAQRNLLVAKDTTESATSALITLLNLNGAKVTIEPTAQKKSIVVKDSRALDIKVTKTSQTASQSDTQKTGENSIFIESTTVKAVAMEIKADISLGEGAEVTKLEVHPQTVVTVAESAKVEEASVKNNGATDTSAKVLVILATDSVDLKEVFGKTSDDAVSSIVDAVTVASATIEGAAITTIYALGGEDDTNTFNYTGLFARLTYTDSTTKDIALNSTNATVAGFNGSALTQSSTATVTYTGAGSGDTKPTKTVTYKVVSIAPYKINDDGTMTFTLYPDFYDFALGTTCLYDNSDQSFWTRPKDRGGQYDDSHFDGTLKADKTKISGIYLNCALGPKGAWNAGAKTVGTRAKNLDGSFSITLSATQTNALKWSYPDFKFIIAFKEGDTADRYCSYIGHSSLIPFYNQKLPNEYKKTGAQYFNGVENDDLVIKEFKALAESGDNRNTNNTNEHSDKVPYTADATTGAITFTFNPDDYYLDFETAALYDNSDGGFPSNCADNNWSLAEGRKENIANVFLVGNFTGWNDLFEAENSERKESATMIKQDNGTYTLTMEDGVAIARLLHSNGSTIFQFIVEYNIDNKQYYQWLGADSLCAKTNNGISTNYQPTAVAGQNTDYKNFLVNLGTDGIGWQ